MMPQKTLRELRLECGWSLNGVVKAMMAVATEDEKKGLPDRESLRRNWIRWESGACVPDGNRNEPFFRLIIARMFGVRLDDLFPPLSPWTAPMGGRGTIRTELQARRNLAQEEISRLEAELAYLNTVLAIPVPADAVDAR
jgi:hypothetical protein